MEPLLSVIVPVYKVEKYLRKCVDSILNQTYSNLEVILVDDGSPDGCGEICDDYAVKDSRVKVVHKENGGAASARNIGISTANGSYVTFVDGDDWLDPRLYDTILRHAPFDIGVFGLTYVYSECNQSRVNAACDFPAVLKWENGKETTSRLIDNSLFGYACNKVYKAEIIKDLQYPEIATREDLLFNIAAYAKTECIMLVNCEGYFYYQHDNNSFSVSYAGPVPDIAGVAHHFVCIHPRFSPQDNQKMINPIIKQYICDAIYKYVIKNSSLSKEEAVSELAKLFSSRTIAKTLCFNMKDNKLFWLLTICMKLNAPKLFYHLVKRI